MPNKIGEIGLIVEQPEPNDSHISIVRNGLEIEISPQISPQSISFEVLEGDILHLEGVISTGVRWIDKSGYDSAGGWEYQPVCCWSGETKYFYLTESSIEPSDLPDYPNIEAIIMN